jgi:lipoprotein-releasing system permease protein
MYRPLALFVGLRYLRAKHANRYVSFISLASVIGVALGVWALIVVISVMNGYANELRNRLLSLSAHVTVRAAHGALRDWPAVEALERRQPGVTGAAPFVEGDGMLMNGTHLSGVQIQGVLPGKEPDVSDIGKELQEGTLESLEPGAHHILLGAVLAQIAEASVGDQVNVLVPRASRGSVEPRLERYTVTGIFEAGTPDQDAMRAYVHLSDAAALFGLGEGVSGVRLRLSDLMRAPEVAGALAANLGTDHAVSDWTQEQATYFRAVKIEKGMMFFILMLIVAVAAFNIVATLVMVVTEKRADIAILRTLGLDPRSVMRIFVVQGTVIGLAGTLVGALLGVIAALNVETIVPRLESVLGVKLIPADVFYVTSVPSDLRWPDVVAITVSAFVLTTLATIYPARRAAATHPAEALRYD